MTSGHFPTEIKLHQKSKVMEIVFSDGRSEQAGASRE